MYGKHFAQTPQRERVCSLIHGSWRQASVKFAAAGACAIMAGQLLVPSVALAADLDQAALAKTVLSSVENGQGSNDGVANESFAETDASQGNVGSENAAATENPVSRNMADPSGDGATGVTDGQRVTVITTVRDNYTDTYEKHTVELVDGVATADGNLAYFNGKMLTFGELGEYTVQATYDAASNKTTFRADTNGIQRQQKEQRHATGYEDIPSLMTTTKIGSKLTYTGTETDKETGETTINEIRDDYYNRHHILVSLQLVIPASPTPKPADPVTPTPAVEHEEKVDSKKDAGTVSKASVSKAKAAMMTKADGLAETGDNATPNAAAIGTAGMITVAAGLAMARRRS